MSSKNTTNRFEGIVIEALPSTTFKVRLDDNKEILAHLAGKLRIHRIKLLPGDRVIVEMANPKDNRGRIVYRKK